MTSHSSESENRGYYLSSSQTSADAASVEKRCSNREMSKTTKTIESDNYGLNKATSKIIGYVKK